ncbi:MAG TPA: hypothetical protein VKD71_04870 [Gemmataceae bacterium]|nr:hypothetical protein [Gemmataceae bacterium]
MDLNNPIVAINERLARQINREARENPNSPYAHKYVGIANGKVVVVADSLHEVAQRLRQIEPDPTKCYAADASADYDKLEEIWADYDTESV